MTVIPAQLPAPRLPRRRQLLFGTAYATAAYFMFFLTLAGTYIAQRSAATTWFAEGQTPLLQPNMMWFTMLLSSVAIQWAVYSIARDDRTHTYLALLITGVLGVAFINQAYFLYTLIDAKMSDPFGPWFYAFTGSQLFMVILAVLFLIVILIRCLGGQYSAKLPDGVSALAIFWHGTVASYCIVWYAVYIHQ